MFAAPRQVREVCPIRDTGTVKIPCHLWVESTWIKHGSRACTGKQDPALLTPRLRSGPSSQESGSDAGPPASSMGQEGFSSVQLRLATRGSGAGPVWLDCPVSGLSPKKILRVGPPVLPTRTCPSHVVTARRLWSAWVWLRSLRSRSNTCGAVSTCTV